MLYSFGREDQLDVAGVRRLVDALSRLLDPADALAAAAPAGLSFVESRPLGGAWLLDGPPPSHGRVATPPPHRTCRPKK
ncbi:hypothetical protein ABGB16_22700 [Micromonospora sp. B11E3]|uniref:hypothetical protein n=1 Tax=Micromonospora sp. B11E3 TaxID=3153562 RepID=UPI00325EA2BD